MDRFVINPPRVERERIEIWLASARQLDTGSNSGFTNSSLRISFRAVFDHSGSYPHDLRSGVLMGLEDVDEFADYDNHDARSVKLACPVLAHKAKSSGFRGAKLPKTH